MTAADSSKNIRQILHTILANSIEKRVQIKSKCIPRMACDVKCNKSMYISYYVCME